MSMHDLAIILFGALAGGFVSGLAGFGTALTTVGIWLHALDPATAATLTLICSVIGQVQSIPTIWKHIDPGRVLPFIIPGLLGVPLGLLALSHIDPSLFKIGIGLLLVCFPAFMLAWRGQTTMRWGGRYADGVVGFLGGILGGMAGLSGALPTVWAALRGWGKDEKRGVFQAFNLAILGAALLTHAASGRVGSRLLVPIGIALPGTFVGVWLGVNVYKRLSDQNFSDLVMSLLLLSGITLLFSLR